MPEEEVTTEAVEAEETESTAAKFARIEKENKRLRRQVEVSDFIRQHPHLEPEDLKGVEKEYWDRLASRIAPPSSGVAAEPESELSEEVVTQTQRITAAAGGVAPTKQEPMSRAELEAKLRQRGMPLDEYKKLLQEGRLPGR